MQSTITPPAIPPPISSHFVFRPLAGLSGRGAAPQAVDTTRVACCPSCTTEEIGEVPCVFVFWSTPPSVMFTSPLCAATCTVPLTSVTSYCVRSLETGATLMQLTCTLIEGEVPTERLPFPGLRKVPWNFPPDSG